MDWDNVRFFLAVARLGTLSRAAKSLEVTHVTVSRRIDRLEALLNETLDSAELHRLIEVVELWCQRLTGISWFMRLINEGVARVASLEFSKPNQPSRVQWRHMCPRITLMN